MLSQKGFSWAKPACFDFSSPNLTVQDHIRSTAGEALSSSLRAKFGWYSSTFDHPWGEAASKIFFRWVSLLRCHVL
jgi:hypothetical protein